MSCVDDAMATFFVQDSHAQCECGINLSDALKVCPSCSKTYKEAIEYWKDKQPKLKQVEADHIAAAQSTSASSGIMSYSGLKEWNGTEWAGITKALHNCFRDYVLPLEGHHLWDTSVIGVDTEEAIRIFQVHYAKTNGKEEKTKLLNEVIRDNDGDEILKSLVHFCKHGTRM